MPFIAATRRRADFCKDRSARGPPSSSSTAGRSTPTVSTTSRWASPMAAFARSPMTGAGLGVPSRRPAGYNYDVFADDLASVIDALGLTATRAGRLFHGRRRDRPLSVAPRRGEDVSRAVFISAVTPFLMQTPDNPHGAPAQILEDMKDEIRADRAEFFDDFFENFYGVGVLTSPVSDGVLRLVVDDGHAGRAEGDARLRRRVRQDRFPSRPQGDHRADPGAPRNRRRDRAHRRHRTRAGQNPAQRAAGRTRRRAPRRARQPRPGGSGRVAGLPAGALLSAPSASPRATCWTSAARWSSGRRRRAPA